jgi:predicted ATPase
MIINIQIDNFKSLVDFKLSLSKFNCLVGLNGAGKSTVLQALDFLSQLMIGDIDKWLKDRKWKSSELNSKLTKKRNIDYVVTLEVEGKEVVWRGSFSRSLLRCTKESITVAGEKILSVEGGSYVYESRSREVVFNYEGSLLSVLKENQQGNTLRKVKEAVKNIRSLDLISPELLRSRARSSEGKLGLGGENLAAFIHEAGTSVTESLKEKLLKVYPHIEEIKTKSLRSGWKQLEVTERYDNTKITSGARHVNDGMLRLMAILMQLDIGRAFLLFDEIENGINPELIEYLIDCLVETEDQILVTTHSPLVLNFLEDSVAKEGVTYLYKNKKGYTQAIKLFDIPSMAKKLEFMGPGEVFVDTDLSQLANEIFELEETLL